MRRIRLLKSKQRSSANQLSLSLDTLKPLVTPFTMDVAQFTKKEPAEKPSTDSKKKQSKTYQHLCLGERNSIERMLKEGLCLSAIARELKRGKQTIASEVSRNGGRASYNAYKAQEKSTERKIQRDIKCSFSIRGETYRPRDELLERIENLEMQIEILSETIKEVARERNKTNH